MEQICNILAAELDERYEYIENVITLLEEGNTIPFIARYRKEMHGSMDDTKLRTLETRLKYLQGLQNRRSEILKAIEGQGKLTDELRESIQTAATLAELEDIYRPYKQKRRTRATVAKEKGLEPLAMAIFQQDNRDPNQIALEYIDPEKGVHTIEDAISGAYELAKEI